uniref:DDE Tnp4 domain-containing protein n=1 Tax=Ditylenchus dipsaci TaxID=166011 RepID=A0A915EDL2_9BILA
MENFELEEAIGWWALRKKRSYVRPAHYKSALHRNSFAVFWRYYSSPDEGDLKRFLRLSHTEFEMIYSLVRRQLEAHCPTYLRPIEEKERLAVFIRFIAFGPTYSAVAPLFVIGDSTVHDICKEKFYSIVLLAIADAESRFLMVDPIKNFLESPEAALPLNEEGSLPFIFLGDGGFGCTDLQGKKRSRARIWYLCSRWRIFLGTIEARPETARLYTLAAVILHNFLIQSKKKISIFDFRRQTNAY